MSKGKLKDKLRKRKRAVIKLDIWRFEKMLWLAGEDFFKNAGRHALIFRDKDDGAEVAIIIDKDTFAWSP